MTAAAPLNYTTTIAASKTIAEIHAALAKHGASAVATLYDVDGVASGVSFQVRGPHGLRTYNLPVDIPAMHQLLIAARRSNSRVQATPEQAARVAWRVVKDWILAQLALTDARMATLAQTMLPYLVVDGERTLYQAYEAREQTALEAGS